MLTVKRIQFITYLRTLTDAELHDVTVTVRNAMTGAETMEYASLFCDMLDVIDAEHVRRARVAMAACETALTA